VRVRRESVFCKSCSIAFLNLACIAPAAACEFPNELLAEEGLSLLPQPRQLGI
jgi:hypothetical protein